MNGELVMFNGTRLM